MAQWLKQSTAIYVQLGPFLDETDGKTAETGLTIAQADVKLSKGGAAFAQKGDANAAVHDAGGWYRCQLNTTDTGTLGRLIVAVHESGALPVWREFLVVPSNVWDSYFSTDKLQVDATQIEGGDATDAINAAVDAALNTAIPGSPTANSINERVAAIDDLTQASGSGDLAAVLADTDELQADWVNGGRLDLLIDSILADTGELQTDWVNGGRLDLLIDSILADTGELQTDWVNGGRLDLLIDAILADTGELQTDWANGGRLDLLIDAIKVVTDSLTDLATVVDAVWDEATSGHAGAGTTGKALTDGITAGAGSITFTYTLTSSVDAAPIGSATVWVTSDEAGSNVVASGTTDTNGEVVFYLDAGTYYVWREKSGWNFTNPDTEAVA